MIRLPEWFQRLRTARARAALLEDPNPDETRALAKLTHEKQLAIVGLFSAYVQNRPDNRTETADLIAEFVPDMSDPTDLGAAAVHVAYTRVIFHLLRELARASGESVDQVWSRVAVELTRQASE